MSERHMNQMEAKVSTTSDNGLSQLQKEAGILFQCKDGSLVHKPTDCTKTIGSLPPLEITGMQLAGKTFRRSSEGVTSDGGKVLQS